MIFNEPINGQRFIQLFYIMFAIRRIPELTDISELAQNEYSSIWALQ